MKTKAYKSFKKQYRALPEGIRAKTNKALFFLEQNYRHPSLHTKKIQGAEGLWEARIDIHYRMTFEIEGDAIYLRAVGNHDEVLKNP